MMLENLSPSKMMCSSCSSDWFLSTEVGVKSPQDTRFLFSPREGNPLSFSCATEKNRGSRIYYQ